MSRKRHITPIDLQDYLVGTGWIFDSNDVRNGQKTVVCSAYPGMRLQIPVDPHYWGANDSIDLTLRMYAEASGQTQEQLRFQIAHVHDDVVRVRLFGGRMRRDLPLDFSTTLVSALDMLLRAGYYAVTHSRTVNSIGSAHQAYLQMFDAKLELDHSDGVSISLACPLGLSRADVGSRSDERPAPMVRRVMRSIRDLLADLVEAMESDRGGEFLERLSKTGHSRMCSEFCEALIGMFDFHLQNAVEISILWSPDHPIDEPYLKTPVHFRPTDCPFIKSTYHALASGKEARDYVGTLAHLQPDNLDGSPGTGKAVISLLKPNGVVVPAHIDLSVENYAKALVAKRSGGYVQTSGVLGLARHQVSLSRMTLTQIASFEVLPKSAIQSA